MCICIVETHHYSPETITTLLISYIPIQNKMLKFVFNKNNPYAKVAYFGAFCCSSGLLHAACCRFSRPTLCHCGL